MKHGNPVNAAADIAPGYCTHTRRALRAAVEIPYKRCSYAGWKESGSLA